MNDTNENRGWFPEFAVVVASAPNSSGVLLLQTMANPPVICVLDAHSTSCSTRFPVEKDVLEVKIELKKKDEFAGFALADWGWHVTKYWILSADEYKTRPDGERIAVVVQKLPKCGLLTAIARGVSQPVFLKTSLSVDPHNFIMASAIRFESRDFRDTFLFDAKMLTPEETKLVETSCRNVNDLDLKTAEMYIRDVFITIRLLERHLIASSARSQEVEVKGEVSTTRVTAFIDNHQIQGGTASPWQERNEVSMFDRAIPDLGNLYLTIDSIRPTTNGIVVVLKPSPRSETLFGAYTGLSDVLGSARSLFIGPTEYGGDSVAQLLENNFASFFEKKDLFGQLYGNAARLDSTWDDTDLHAALLTTFNASGVACLEGPPGSGKTRVTVAMVAHEYAQKEKSGRICLAGGSNSAVSNALDTAHAAHPTIPMIRIYSRSAEEHLLPSSKEISLTHMIQNLNQHHLDHVDQLVCRNTLERHYEEYTAASRQFNANRGTDSGLHALKKMLYLEAVLRTAFLRYYPAMLVGMSIEVLARNNDDMAAYRSDGSKPVTHLILKEASKVSPAMALAAYAALPDLKNITVLGDSKQLRPFTDFIEGSMAHKIANKGELERLQETRKAPTMSNVYGIHPRIVDLLLKPVYGQQLVANAFTQDPRIALLPTAKDENHSPVLFVHLKDCVDRFTKKGSGKWNHEECDAVVAFVEGLGAKGIAGNEVAVVCYLKDQCAKISSLLKDMRGTAGPEVNVCTVGQMSSKQAKVVIVLTSKTCTDGQHPKDVLSFVADPRRGAVAVSRGQQAVYLFGQWDKLVQTDFWRQFAPSIIDNKALVTSDWRPASDDLYNKVRACSEMRDFREPHTLGSVMPFTRKMSQRARKNRAKKG